MQSTAGGADLSIRTAGAVELKGGSKSDDLIDKMREMPCFLERLRKSTKNIGLTKTSQKVEARKGRTLRNIEPKMDFVTEQLFLKKKGSEAGAIEYNERLKNIKL